METAEDAKLHRDINRFGPSTCVKVAREVERRGLVETITEKAKELGGESLLKKVRKEIERVEGDVAKLVKIKTWLEAGAPTRG